jgi:tRNA G18 (ribose-2'-O)-methylase SpoU
MGTVFALPHARTSTLATDLQLLDGFDLYAMTPAATATALDEVRPGGKVAVLIGSERAGLSPELLALATPVRIPMAAGVDSLNAAAATAVACYALRGQSR